MALTLTIGGANFLPQYKTNTAVIKEQLQNKSNVLNIEIVKKPSQTKPGEAKEIILKDGSRFLFAGFITRVNPIEIGVGQLFTYDVEATDYTYILINHQAQKVYESMTMKAIIEDLIATFAPGYSLTTTNVDTGPTITRMSFSFISLRKCFEKLANYSGYEWWIDFEKNIYFKPKTATSAPASFNDVVQNFSEVDIKVDVTQVRNSIVVQGGREETVGTQTEEFLANGVDRKWILKDKPREVTLIEYDSGSGYAAATIGVENLDDETLFDFMFSFQEKYVRIVDTTPLDGYMIRITYKYEVPVLTLTRSTASILAMKALEGGDGIHDYLITDTTIKTKTEARQRAIRELDEYANPLMNAIVKTRTGLLGAGVYFKPGQELLVNFPSWGISVDSRYLIQEVVTSLVEDGTNIEYHYNIRFGGRLLNAATFLEDIGTEGEVIDEEVALDKIFAVDGDDITIVESIVRNPMTRSVSESITIAESVSRTNTTPPFKWAPSGTKKLQWNKGEWA